MSDLFSAVKQFCTEQGPNRVFRLGLSGGLDSVVLLHLLVQVRSVFPIELQAIHIHHGLSPYADTWVMHCRELCNAWQVDFAVHHINAKANTGESQEEIAREHRYAIFQKCVAENNILLTAHHQNDQAETVLLQLFRGAGPKGLAAMPFFTNFYCGFLARPLLFFSRENLQEYAERFQLKWIEDESNTNTTYTRNFLRHDIIPLLKKQWPSVTSTLARVAQHCAETQMLLEKYIKKDFDCCTGSQVNTLSIQKLKQFDQMQMRALIRFWLQQNHVEFPSATKMHHILEDMLYAKQDKQPRVQWGDVELRRFQDNLYLLQKEKKEMVGGEYEWDFTSPLVIGKEKYVAHLTKGSGLSVELVKKVKIKFRQAGEVCRLPGRKHHHALKKILQEYNVPPWLRENIPLIFLGEELIAIPGYFLAMQYAAKESESGWIVTYQC